jgi:hypothetical protein
MTSTYWESEDVPADRLAPSHDGKPRERLGAGTGAGGMYSTVEDMARYVAFQLDAYPARDDRDDGAIRRATRREAHSTGIHGQTHVALAPAAQPGDPMVHVATGTYGFGWAREENCYFDEMIGHGGVIDSYRAEVSFLPSRGVGVAVLSNFPNSNPQAVSRLVLEELRKTGALAARVEPLAPGFEPAVKSFLNVLNRYDDAALKEMLDPERPPLPVEKDELLGYHALHGTCTGYHVVEATGRTQARIGLTCERGTFEVMLQLHPVSKKVIGFVGTSRDVAAPPALAAAAEAIVGLGDRWDDAVYTKYLSKVSLPREDLQRGIAQVAAAHGSCKVKTVVHVGFDWGFDLACERGGGLRLTINTVPGDLSAVTGLGVQPLQEGLCPLR